VQFELCQNHLGKGVWIPVLQQSETSGLSCKRVLMLWLWLHQCTIVARNLYDCQQMAVATIFLWLDVDSYIYRNVSYLFHTGSRKGPIE